MLGAFEVEPEFLAFDKILTEMTAFDCCGPEFVVKIWAVGRGAASGQSGDICYHFCGIRIVYTVEQSWACLDKHCLVRMI